MSLTTSICFFVWRWCPPPPSPRPHQYSGDDQSPVGHRVRHIVILVSAGLHQTHPSVGVPHSDLQKQTLLQVNWTSDCGRIKTTGSLTLLLDLEPRSYKLHRICLFFWWEQTRTWFFLTDFVSPHSISLLWNLLHINFSFWFSEQKNEKQVWGEETWHRHRRRRVFSSLSPNH